MTPHHPSREPDRDPQLWARRASSFGSGATEYAEHRPDYAADAVAWVLGGVEGGVETRRVLDLAAGTGVITRALLDLGIEVVAVEPDADMRAELARRLPGVEVVDGRAEAIPLPDDSVDAVLVGTAFHWFDRERACPEMARVLRPGGVLGLLYNLDDETVPWVVGLAAVSRTSASTPRNPDQPWPDCAGFGSLEERRFPHRQRRTASSLTATIGTHSHTRVVDDEEREATLTRVREYLDAQPETSHGEFDLPLVSVAARARVAPVGQTRVR